MYYGMKLRKTYQQNIIVLRGLSKGVKSLSTAQPVMATNVLALGAVADFGAQNCQYTTKVDAR